MKTGIHTRLLFTTSVVLGTCLFFAGYVLDRSFQASVIAGAEEQLRPITYSLMGAVEVDDGRVSLATEPPEPRLNQPESGLYASVRAGGVAAWVSTSALTTDVLFPDDALAKEPGEFLFTQAGDVDPAMFFLSYAVIWEADDGAVLTFTVATDATEFQAAIGEFRRNLSVGAVAVALLFIAAQFAALRWGLAPLRQMAEEVREVESGQRERLSVGYPVELARLAENLDAFVEHEHRSRTRYRHALEDLAHSLKTPLAVVRNALTGRGQAQEPLITEQLDRMEATVHHQLSRASARGPVVVGGLVDLTTVAGRLLRALETAYVEKKLDLHTQFEDGLGVRGDEGDLMEILGNLFENAFKYTAERICVLGRKIDDGVELLVEDDGPGIPQHMRTEVLNRGTRADEVMPGQGIGLSVVAELVALYQGELSIDDSELGGARIRVVLR